MPVLFDHEKSTRHTFFHSFCYHPKTTFEGQYKNEDVVVTFRAHPITQIPWLVTAVVMLFAPMFFMYFIAGFFSIQVNLFLLLFYYLCVFGYCFVNFIQWLFNIGIITTERVIDVDYSNIINKEITSASNADIADVTVKTFGFLPTLFHMGNVEVQTAGTAMNIEFRFIPNPDQVVSIISQYAEIAENG